MRRVRRGRTRWLLGSALATMGLAYAGVAVADDISNNLDGTIDATAEVMSLNTNGATGATQLYVQPRNGDGKGGCNLTGSTTLVVSVASSDTSVATVSPSSITFGSCGDTPTLVVTPHNQGTAHITLGLTSNSTGGTFNLAPGAFDVVVAPPPNTPPQMAILGVTGGTSYSKGSVPTATCQVTDLEDGNSSFAATLSAITGTYASDGIGDQTASCSYTDAGGLTASQSVTYNIVDPSPPDISYVLTPSSPDGDYGWYKNDVSLVWTVSDPESPNSLVKLGCDDHNITADQGATTYSCSASSAGGSAAPVNVTIKRDATAPTIHGSASPAANSNGWNKSDVMVSFTCDDNLSGVASCGPDKALTAEGANQSLTGTAKDNAGNTASDLVSEINIDKTAPAVSVTGATNGATYTLGSVPAAGCSTTDALSGVQTPASLSLSGGPLGQVTATCDGAKDKADNLAGPVTVKYNVVYAWTGFFQPVDNLPAWNSAKAGSAIPVKFNLGGNQGLSIFADGPGITKVACVTGATIDPIETYITTTAGGSSLTYDTTASQYVYVWKTDKTWAGSCYRFQFKLNDGTTHAFSVQFTK